MGRNGTKIRARPSLRRGSNDAELPTAGRATADGPPFVREAAAARPAPRDVRRNRRHHEGDGGAVLPFGRRLVGRAVRPAGGVRRGSRRSRVGRQRFPSAAVRRGAVPGSGRRSRPGAGVRGAGWIGLARRDLLLPLVPAHASADGRGVRHLRRLPGAAAPEAGVTHSRGDRRRAGRRGGRGQPVRPAGAHRPHAQRLRRQPASAPLRGARVRRRGERARPQGGSPGLEHPAPGRRSSRACRPRSSSRIPTRGRWSSSTTSPRGWAFNRSTTSWT